MTQLVIFDCDGVLVDSEPISVRIDVEMFAEVGIAMSEQEVIDRFVGRSPEVLAEAIEEQLGQPPPDGWEERGERRLRQAFEAELEPVAGIRDALERISLPVCVASSSPPERLRFKLELTGLYERFAGRIFSATEVANGKPAPDLFLHAAAVMGVEPGACAVVEDAPAGIEAANAAGMVAFGYAALTPRHLLAGATGGIVDQLSALGPHLVP